MKELRKEVDNSQLPVVAVAVDKDKSSQVALKWTLENLISKGQCILLVHVKSKPPNPSVSTEAYAKELFLPFRCFCTRKEVQCRDVILEEGDIAKAIVEFASQNTVEKLVVGAAAKGGFVRRFKTADVPTTISKGAPDFCTVYVISKGKVSSVRNAVRQAPMVNRTLMPNQPSIKTELATPPLPAIPKAEGQLPIRPFLEEKESIKSPFTRGIRGATGRSYGELSLPETDISFVSSGRPSTDRMFPSLFDEADGQNRLSRVSNSTDSFDSSYDMMIRTPRRFIDMQSPANDYPSSISYSQESATSSWSSQPVDDVEAEMRRLRLELKQTMDMYSAACKEALTAKQKASDLNVWKMEKERRMEEARLAEESAMVIIERERAKCKAAIEAAEAAQRIAELEAQKRINVEMKALREAEERRKSSGSLPQTDLRYRRYTIEEIEEATEYFSEKRKIGEGGYGPVYRGHLDHTPVAIKVLRPDAAQGQSQFQQEIEVLSCMRHPNMVLLLGACPEFGCLVYEHMTNGSLEDRLFRRGNTPVIPWQIRFRIAAEIATGLLFLHQTKPEPLVHRDLKPANILLDRNYVSKISDVGLARLVPPNVADDVTQYRMTSAAGTFCYIDPEYQQTGMLGIKSDVYSLGILLLQLITAKPPMGLTHHVEFSIEKGTFAEMLDPAVEDWPIEAALCFAKLSLQCAELRRRDRPDLGKVVLPELNRLRMLAEENMHNGMMGGSTVHSPMYSQASIISQETLSDAHFTQSDTESSRSRSSISSLHGMRASIA